MPTKKHREKQVEARIVKRAKEHGGTAYKFTSPGRRSVPDRLMAMPCWDLKLPFIEAKAEGQDLTDAQKREKAKIEARGGIVFKVDSYESCDALFEMLCDGSCRALDT